uniref:Putative ovule protein n=2 Tax=Solanum chacoense TaxID=4108 RepID=A0A0V0H116_SOLCH
MVVQGRSGVEAKSGEIGGLAFNQIGGDNSVWLGLDSAFDDRVGVAVECCVGDKAPGPDGFTLTLFQCCWSVVKVDVLSTIDEFYEKGKFDKSLNTSFIVIIPNKEDVASIGDYIPISLVGSMYKTISKVLSNRLESFGRDIVFFAKCLC